MSTRYGSDVVVSLLQEAGVEYVAFNPGATFRGLHDSLAHAGEPGIVLCPHEGISVAVAHGYAKAAGRAMAALLHDVVGLQHGAMAIYNAWCDRVPLLALGGTGPMSRPARRPWIDWIHTALVQGNLVRDFVKWDDQPADLASVPDAFWRAWTATNAAPRGPVYLCLDAGLQEEAAPGDLDAGTAADHPVPTPPAPAAPDLAQLADELARASLPVLLSDYAGDTEQGFRALGELAELLHAPVVDCGQRFCFPVRHELNFTGLEDVLDDADLALCLDVEAPAGRVAGLRSARVVSVSPAHLRLRSWAHDFGPLVAGATTITGALEVALPALLEALRSRGVDGAVRDERRRRLAGRRDQALAEWQGEAASAEADAAMPAARLAAELGRLLEGERWTLVHGSLEGWERRLWPFERHGQHLGWHGGGGLGYGYGAAIGAALALGPETLCLNVQPDGDLLYLPSALWTAARYRLPVMTVMHNNRQYRNTVEHAERVARERSRDPERRYEGAGIDDPAVDFAALARSFGVAGFGPVTSPDELGPAWEEARTEIAAGRPALIDVLTTGA